MEWTICAEGLVGDKIAGQKDSVGLQAVDSIDGVVKEEWLGELFEVNVAELDNVKAIECGGKIGQANFKVCDFEEMPRNFTRVEREA